MELFDRALSYGANINIAHPQDKTDKTEDLEDWERGILTPLSIATAHGNVDWARRLLNAGADVRQDSTFELSTLSDDFPALKVGVDAFDSVEELYFVKVDFLTCLPLCLAMLMNNRELTALLIGRGAPAEVAWRSWSSTRSLTVHHICAVNDAMGAGKWLLERFPASINTRTWDEDLRTWGEDTGTWDQDTEDGGFTPLYMAMEARNTPFFDALISAGADVNIRSTYLEITPLHHAINKCAIAHTARDRRQLLKYTLQLIGAGADVNLTDASGLTPLMYVMNSTECDWESCFREMELIMTTLLDHGARIDHRSPRGVTCVEILIENIALRGPRVSTSLEKLLEELVTKHGAELNYPSVPFSPLGSLFWRCGNSISSRWRDMPPRLIGKLIKLGAVLHHDEAPRVFKSWAVNSPLWSLYDMTQHRDHIPRHTVYQTYREFFQEKNARAIDHLLDVFTPPDPEGLVWHAFRDEANSREMVKRLFQITFDASWTHPEDGGSFLHNVVAVVAAGHFMTPPYEYKEADAIKDVKEFIKRGASLTTRDKKGMTAMETLLALQGCKKPRSKLQLLLKGEGDGEDGEY